ncbi:MAG: S8 family serine peptidase [Candidatus Altiarchaeota archaeon]
MEKDYKLTLTLILLTALALQIPFAGAEYLEEADSSPIIIQSELVRVIAEEVDEELFSEYLERGCRIKNRLLDSTSFSCPIDVISGLAVREARIFRILDLASDQQIRADLVWAQGINGSGVNVAILDSGIDTDHPELADSYLGGYDFVNDDSFPEDDNGHGTHVAGIITANGQSDPNSVGVAPEAGFYMYKVCDSVGDCFEDDMMAAMEAAVGTDAKVMSISIGGGSFLSEDCDSDPLAAKVNWVADQGLTVVVSAGNDGQGVSSPGCASEAVAVGAVNLADEVVFFSGRGPALDIVAPGYDVYSTVIGGYGLKSGTSMAAPHISGVISLLLHANSTLTTPQIKDALYSTTTSVSKCYECTLWLLGTCFGSIVEIPCTDDETAAGIVDAYAAYLSVSSSNTSTTTSTSSTSTSSTTTTLPATSTSTTTSSTTTSTSISSTTTSAPTVSGIISTSSSSDGHTIDNSNPPDGLAELPATGLYLWCGDWHLPSSANDDIYRCELAFDLGGLSQDPVVSASVNLYHYAVSGQLYDLLVDHYTCDGTIGIDDHSGNNLEEAYTSLDTSTATSANRKWWSFDAKAQLQDDLDIGRSFSCYRLRWSDLDQSAADDGEGDRIVFRSADSIDTSQFNNAVPYLDYSLQVGSTTTSTSTTSTSTTSTSTTSTSITTTSSTSTSTSTTSTIGFFQELWRANSTGTYDEFADPIYDAEANIVYIGSKALGSGEGWQKVFALNASDGSKLWNYSLGNTDSTGFIYEDRICLGGQEAGMVCAFKQSGTQICNVSGNYRFAPVILNDVIYLLGDEFNDLSSFNVSDCSLISENMDVPGPYGGIIAASDVCGIICFGGSSPDLDGDYFGCYGIDDLSKKWGSPTPKTWDSTPAIDERTCKIYQGASYGNGGLYAFDINGSALWNCTYDSDVKAGPVFFEDYLISVSERDGYVLALNISEKFDDHTTCGERIIWNTTQSGASHSVYGTPAIAYGYVFVTDRGSNHLQVYNLTTGEEVDLYDDIGATYSSPAVANGVLYIGADDWYTYALNMPSITPVTGEDWHGKKGNAQRTGYQQGPGSSSTTTSSTSTTSSSSTSTTSTSTSTSSTSSTSSSTISSTTSTTSSTSTTSTLPAEVTVYAENVNDIHVYDSSDPLDGIGDGSGGLGGYLFTGDRGGGSFDNDYRVVVAFSLADVPAIHDGEVCIHHYYSLGSAEDTQVDHISCDGTPDQGDYGSSPIDETVSILPTSTATSTNDKYWCFDATNQVQADIGLGSDYSCFRFYRDSADYHNDGGTDGVYFNQGESAYSPYLQVALGSTTTSTSTTSTSSTSTSTSSTTSSSTSTTSSTSTSTSSTSTSSTSTTSTLPETVTITAQDANDNHVYDQSDPLDGAGDGIGGLGDYIYIGDRSGGADDNNYRGIISFDLGGISASLSSAELCIYHYTLSGTRTDILVDHISCSGNPLTEHYQTPSLTEGFSFIDTSAATATNDQYWCVDATSQVQEDIDLDRARSCFRYYKDQAFYEDDGLTDGIYFQDGSNTNPPYIELTIN